MSKVRTLHFSYAKMSKLRTHRKCPPYQMTTHFLHKQVKIASLIGMSTISITTLFLYKHAKIASSSQMSTISVTHQTQHKSIHYTFLYKHVKIAAMHNCPPIQHYTYPYQNKPKLRHTCYANKCPLYQYQSPHIYHTKQMSTISITIHLPHKTNVHYINHCTFPIQTSQNCGHQLNHYTFTTQKMSFSRFWTHTNRFQLCCSSLSDFKSVGVIHQISTLMWWPLGQEQLYELLRKTPMSLCKTAFR